MPKIKKVDHIGIVVRSVGQAVSRYENLLFLQPSHREYFEDAKVELAFFDIGGVCIELIGPTESHGEIWSSVQDKEGSLHHICYEVEDLPGILEELKAKGIKLIDEKPRPGSRNSQIAFVDPDSANGVLIEYCEFANV